MSDDWRNNPRLAGMDRSKLDMLQNLAAQGSTKGVNDMMPFLMNAAAQGKKGGLNFNADEISAIIDVLKMGKSGQEIQKLYKVINFINSLIICTTIKRVHSRKYSCVFYFLNVLFSHS